MSSLLGIYIAETAHKSHRNVFSSCRAVFPSVGLLISYWLGYLTDWRTLSKCMAGTL